MAEEWREIPGTAYVVSNEGRVISHHSKWRGGKLLNQNVNQDGYPSVVLCKNGTMLTRLVHRLVAEMFIGPSPTSRHQVNHKNGIKTDNRVSNLEWVTNSENQRHSYHVLGNKAAYGEANGSAKLTAPDVRRILDRLAAGETQDVIAADYGICQANISMIATGKTWGWLRA